MMKTCVGCKENKAEIDFSGRSKKCKKCVCEHVKTLYKEKGRSYQRTKKKLKEKSECNKCGRQECLEFDHLNRGEKTFTIGQNQSSRDINDEAKKCRILCIWCHRIETYNFNNEAKRERLIESVSCPDPNGIVCDGELCRGEKIGLDNFYSRKRGGIMTPCVSCISYTAYQKRKAIAEYVNSMKRFNGMCVLCEVKVVEGNEMCFDYDHIDPLNKKCNVSNFVQHATSTKSDIDKEIEKCRLLCCVCHFKHTNSVKKYHTRINR